MAQNLVMRQMDERTTNQEIRLLLWSPKMDILATGQIFTLKCTRVFLFSRIRIRLTCIFLVSSHPDSMDLQLFDLENPDLLDHLHLFGLQDPDSDLLLVVLQAPDPLDLHLFGLKMDF